MKILIYSIIISSITYNITKIKTKFEIANNCVMKNEWFLKNARYVCKKEPDNHIQIHSFSEKN